MSATNWKNKLLAFLHDPPHKPFRIAGHEDARGPLLRHVGLSEDDIDRWEAERRRCSPDWQAAAADRFPFPRADVVFVDWKTDGALEFRHPLAGSRFQPANTPRGRSAVGESWIEQALHGIPTDQAGWKAKYFRVWRLWPERCAREKHPLLAYLVADTRIPDHTLWHHNGVVSALEAVGDQPAFLEFQIGPVQDFIKQARKLQDLWAGSYLLSFLISKALATIALELGPDVVIYPNLRGVPLLDWWWLKDSEKTELFPDGYFEVGKGRLHHGELLTPSLPNRFLALVPCGDEGRRIAHAAEKAVRTLWTKIAGEVHAEVCARLGQHLKQGKFEHWDYYWSNQVQRFPMIEWTILPWGSKSEIFANAGAKFDPMPPLSGGWENHPIRLAELWREMIPQEDQESWHGSRNDGFAWPLHSAATDWHFAALKSTRDFARWPQPEEAHLSPPKDHLNGRDEVLGGENPEAFWEALRPAFIDGNRDEFKGKQFYGAVNVIKRLWPRVYLGEALGWKLWKPLFESVEDIAAIAAAIEAEPEEWSAHKDEAKSAPTRKRPTYYAVLCMDGDDMGQWVSGVKAPPLGKVLAEKAWKYFTEKWQPLKSRLDGKEIEWHAITGAIPAEDGQPERCPVQRPLGPGYHAALSESLSNFGLYCAGQIVEAFRGQLIYTGGDDVLAMLPADSALDCAHALQLAFRGELPAGISVSVRKQLESLFEFYPGSPGFLRCLLGGKDESQRPNWPLIVPGPRATASVGIAIGHVHAPMQETIQAAREAEAEAKRVPGKNAFCLRVLKRSGESTGFAARWQANSGGQASVADVWTKLEANEDRLTGRFPYRFLQLIRPLIASTGKDADRGWEPRWTGALIEAVEAELRHVYFQQNESGKSAEEKRSRAKAQASAWMESLVGRPGAVERSDFRPPLTPRGFLHFWMTWAFVRRLQPNSKP